VSTRVELEQREKVTCPGTSLARSLQARENADAMENDGWLVIAFVAGVDVGLFVMLANNWLRSRWPAPREIISPIEVLPAAPAPAPAIDEARLKAAMETLARAGAPPAFLIMATIAVLLMATKR